MPATPFTDPAPVERLERVAASLTARNFAAEILDDAAAARARIKDLIPEGASVFTGASETLRLSGIEEDINARAIWIVGAQKVVPDLPAALRRIEDHCLPLENDRAMKVYGQPSAINRVLILKAERHPRRGTVLISLADRAQGARHSPVAMVAHPAASLDQPRLDDSWWCQKSDGFAEQQCH